MTDTKLRSLLTPLGTHRTTYLTPSRGRRRKRAHRAADATAAPPEVPPIPELAAYVDVGMASISRNLEAMSTSKEAYPVSGDAVAQAGKTSARGEQKPYSAVFVARSGHSSSFHHHFPQMVAVASKSQPSEPAIRLVGFSAPCEERLGAALGVPRVSAVALRSDAPQAKGLIDFVRDRVAPVEVAWIQEAQAAEYRQAKINAIQTRVGSAKAKRPRNHSQQGNLSVSFGYHQE